MYEGVNQEFVAVKFGRRQPGFWRPIVVRRRRRRPILVAVMVRTVVVVMLVG